MARAQRNFDPGRAPEVRDRSHVERERPEAGPPVQPHEDEGPDACGHEAGDQDHTEERSADPRRLHQQEGTDDGRTQQGGDGGKAPGGTDDEGGHRRRVLFDQMDGQYPEPTPDGDEGCLGTEHRTQAEGGQRREDDPREIDDLDPSRSFEAFRRLVPPGAVEILQRERNQEAAQHEREYRPPGRGPAEAEVLREGREHERLGDRDEVEVEVRDGRHRDADHRPQHDQRDVILAPEDRQGVGGTGGRRGRCARIRHLAPVSFGSVQRDPGSLSKFIRGLAG